MKEMTMSQNRNKQHIDHIWLMTSEFTLTYTCVYVLICV